MLAGYINTNLMQGKGDNAASAASASSRELSYDLSAIEQLISTTTSLASNIDQRLAGSVYAGFWLEGSKGGPTDALKRNIGDVLELKRALEALMPVMQKAVKPVTQEADKETKKPGKTNANMTATIRNIIDQEISGKLRDLQIENTGLKARVEKSEKKSDDLSRELVSVNSQVKKAAGGNGSGTSEMQVLSRKVTNLQKEIQQVKLDKETLDDTKSKLSTLRDQVWRLDAQLHKSEDWSRKQIIKMETSIEANTAWIEAFEEEEREMDAAETEMYPDDEAGDDEDYFDYNEWDFRHEYCAGYDSGW